MKELTPEKLAGVSGRSLFFRQPDELGEGDFGIEFEFGPEFLQDGRFSGEDEVNEVGLFHMIVRVAQFPAFEALGLFDAGSFSNKVLFQTLDHVFSGVFFAPGIEGDQVFISIFHAGKVGLIG